ncbi:hypothetical protein [Aquitalea magnusonii]|uniref:hypothetical protein n=1 Tax=Aquitalea magnusonii TaxID=332411 RepID=UPI0011B52374|nr:hypothetical protein [Aquitalea magnusonii]
MTGGTHVTPCIAWGFVLPACQACRIASGHHSALPLSGALLFLGVLMNKPSPFARAIAFMQALAAISAMPIAQQMLARAHLGTYESNGHGRDRFTGRFNNHRRTRHQGPAWKTQWAESGCGAREVARRQRQIAQGMLQVSPV